MGAMENVMARGSRAATEAARRLVRVGAPDRKRSLANVLDHLGDGARIIAGGPKWAPWRRSDGLSSNLSEWRMNRECVTTFEGFTRPWSHLEQLVDDLVVDEVFHGGGYVASAATPA
jgi:hypothetical protein